MLSVVPTGLNEHPGRCHSGVYVDHRQFQMAEKALQLGDQSPALSAILNCGSND
jgi:hypothetical protein